MKKISFNVGFWQGHSWEDHGSGGHGFSRAETAPPTTAALAAEVKTPPVLKSARNFFSPADTANRGSWEGHGFSRAATALSMVPALAAEGRRKSHLLKTLLIALLLLVPLSAFSQNCALCYTQAASSGARMIAALRSGILILIIPPTLMSIAMIFVVYRKRNQFRGFAAPAAEDGEWQQLR
jgi:hypothetical protein